MLISLLKKCLRIAKVILNTLFVVFLPGLFNLARKILAHIFYLPFLIVVKMARGVKIVCIGILDIFFIFLPRYLGVAFKILLNIIRIVCLPFLFGIICVRQCMKTIKNILLGMLDIFFIYIPKILKIIRLALFNVLRIPHILFLGFHKILKFLFHYTVYIPIKAFNILWKTSIRTIKNLLNRIMNIAKLVFFGVLKIPRMVLMGFQKLMQVLFRYMILIPIKICHRTFIFFRKTIQLLLKYTIYVPVLSVIIGFKKLCLNIFEVLFVQIPKGIRAVFGMSLTVLKTLVNTVFTFLYMVLVVFRRTIFKTIKIFLSILLAIQKMAKNVLKYGFYIPSIACIKIVQAVFTKLLNILREFLTGFLHVTIAFLNITINISKRIFIVLFYIPISQFLKIVISTPKMIRYLLHAFFVFHLKLVKHIYHYFFYMPTLCSIKTVQFVILYCLPNMLAYVYHNLYYTMKGILRELTEIKYDLQKIAYFICCKLLSFLALIVSVLYDITVVNFRDFINIARQTAFNMLHIAFQEWISITKSGYRQILLTIFVLLPNLLKVIKQLLIKSFYVILESLFGISKSILKGSVYIASSACLAIIISGLLFDQSPAEMTKVNVSVSPVYVSVQAKENTVFSSETSATIKSIPFRAGDAFVAGSILVEFDCRVQKADLRKALAQLESAASTAKSAEKLKKFDSISEQELIKAKADGEIASAEVDKLTAIVDKCTIKAPYDGVVSEAMVHAGESVKPGDPLLKIVNVNDLELHMQVPSVWLEWLKVGNEFKITIDEIKKTFKAKVTKINPEIDPVSQTVKIVGVVLTPEPLLLPGMSGQANFSNMVVRKVPDSLSINDKGKNNKVGNNALAMPVMCNNMPDKIIQAPIVAHTVSSHSTQNESIILNNNLGNHEVLNTNKMDEVFN